jgi:MtN3 and saliva related transmembrane protein
MPSTEILGLIAGLIATSASLPQAWKIIRTRSAGDVSLTMFLMALCGSVLWLIYGYLEEAPSIMFWNMVAILQFTFIIALKLRHTGKT